MKFHKKIEVVDAIKWDGSAEKLEAIRELVKFCLEYTIEIEPEKGLQREIFVIRSYVSKTPVMKGSWVFVEDYHVRVSPEETFLTYYEPVRNEWGKIYDPMAIHEHVVIEKIDFDSDGQTVFLGANYHGHSFSFREDKQHFNPEIPMFMNCVEGDEFLYMGLVELINRELWGSLCKAVREAEEKYGE